RGKNALAQPGELALLSPYEGAWRQQGRARIWLRGRGVMRRLGANGTTIAYAGTGMGPPFVLAHGAEGSNSAPLALLTSSQVLATRAHLGAAAHLGSHSRSSAGRLNISSAQLRSALPLPCNLTPRKPKCAITPTSVLLAFSHVPLPCGFAPADVQYKSRVGKGHALEAPHNV